VSWASGKRGKQHNFCFRKQYLFLSNFFHFKKNRSRVRRFHGTELFIYVKKQKSVQPATEIFCNNVVCAHGLVVLAPVCQGNHFSEPVCLQAGLADCRGQYGGRVQYAHAYSFFLCGNDKRNVRCCNHGVAWHDKRNAGGHR